MWENRENCKMRLKSRVEMKAKVEMRIKDE